MKEELKIVTAYIRPGLKDKLPEMLVYFKSKSTSSFIENCLEAMLGVMLAEKQQVKDETKVP